MGDADARLGTFTRRVRSILTSCVIWIPRPQWIRNSALKKDRVLVEESVPATTKSVAGQLRAREKSNGSVTGLARALWKEVPAHHCIIAKDGNGCV